MINLTFLVCDTETTGFQPPPAPASGIVEIAWAEINPSTLDIYYLKNEITNPGTPIPKAASEVHGIYDEDVVSKPTPSQVFQVKGPLVIIGHNVAFDMRFMAPLVENLAGTLCTWELAKRYVRGTKNHKLQTLADAFGLERGEAHRAGGDVVTTISFLRHLQEDQGKTLLDFYGETRTPKPYLVMPFGKFAGRPMNKVPLSYMDWYLKLPEEEQDRNLRLTFQQQIATRSKKHEA